DQRHRSAPVGRHRWCLARPDHLQFRTASHPDHHAKYRPDRRRSTVCRADPSSDHCPTRHRRSVLHHDARFPGGHTMTTTLTTARKTPGEILLRFVAWEFWRNFRMADATFFVVILPTAMYLMFGVAMDQGGQPAGEGN